MKTTLQAPYLRSATLLPENVEPGRFPFTVPAFAKPFRLEFPPVTFLVGESGSGKSTLLEALAQKCGFHLRGGNKNHLYELDEDLAPLAEALRLSWKSKTSKGFFLRAESFFHFATYVDELAREDESILRGYGGKSLHAQSHGESFLSLFRSRFHMGIFLMDEPEAALSPQAQLGLVSLMHDLVLSGTSQFVIATHSPLLFSYPGATVVQLDEQGMRSVDYRETGHFRLMRDFLQAPERFLRHLLARGDED